MQVVKRPEVFEAVQFLTGMEDGYIVDGVFLSKRVWVPSNAKSQTAIGTTTEWNAVDVGDWVVTAPDGLREVYTTKQFIETFSEKETLS